MGMNVHLKQVVLMALLLPGSVVAAPDGADLLRACETALENDFEGINGGMCGYYVRPCDCDAGRPVDAPRVCLPESMSAQSLAKRIIQGLKEEPSLQQRDAAVAAAVILSREYPCP